MRVRRASRLAAPGRRRAQCTARTTPACGARSGSSIFMASSVTSTSPRATSSPRSDVDVPHGRGHRRRQRVGPAGRARGSRRWRRGPELEDVDVAVRVNPQPRAVGDDVREPLAVAGVDPPDAARAGFDPVLHGRRSRPTRLSPTTTSHERSPETRRTRPGFTRRSSSQSAATTGSSVATPPADGTDAMLPVPAAPAAAAAATVGIRRIRRARRASLSSDPASRCRSVPARRLRARPARRRNDTFVRTPRTTVSPSAVRARASAVSARGRVHDHFGDERIELHRHIVAFSESCIDADARSRGRAEHEHAAALRQEPCCGILGIHAALDRMAAWRDLRLRPRQWLAARDAQLRVHEVDADDGFRHRDARPAAACSSRGSRTRASSPSPSSRNSTVPAFTYPAARGDRRPRPRPSGPAGEASRQATDIPPRLFDAGAGASTRARARAPRGRADRQRPAPRRGGAFRRAVRRTAYRRRRRRLHRVAHRGQPQPPRRACGRPACRCRRRRLPASAAPATPTRRTASTTASSVESPGISPGTTGTPTRAARARAAVLEPICVDRVGGRPDEDEARALARPRERRPLREETVARMNGLRTCGLRGVHDALDVEVAVAGRPPAERDDAVREARVQRVAIDVRADRPPSGCRARDRRG